MKQVEVNQSTALQMQHNAQLTQLIIAGIAAPNLSEEVRKELETRLLTLTELVELTVPVITQASTPQLITSDNAA